MMFMVLAKIEPNGLVGDQVFDAIHAAIMNGKFRAGHRLRIQDLAAQLGTSHMPVREALRRLEETGLTENLPYKGAVVKGHVLQELLHIYAVRRVLEVEASRAGSELISLEGIQGMRDEFESVQEALREERVIDYLDHDERALSTLYAASGNPLLHEMIRGLWNRCRQYKMLGAQQALASNDTSMLWDQEQQLLEAVVARDSEAVGQIIDESLLSAIERIKERLLSETTALASPV